MGISTFQIIYFDKENRRFVTIGKFLFKIKKKVGIKKYFIFFKICDSRNTFLLYLDYLHLGNQSIKDQSIYRSS